MGLKAYKFRAECPDDVFAVLRRLKDTRRRRNGKTNKLNALRRRNGKTNEKDTIDCSSYFASGLRWLWRWGFKRGWGFGAIAGSWLSNSGNGDVEAFAADCSGTSSLCQSTFSYPDATASTGTTLVQVNTTASVSGCLTVGVHSCAYAISGTSLQFNCGGGVLSYTKQ